MPARWLLCATLLLLTGAGAAQAADKEKLRGAARLPSQQCKLGVGFKYGRFYLVGTRIDLDADIAAQQKRLADAPDDVEVLLRLADLCSSADRTDEVQRHYTRAETVLRRQMEREPKQARLVRQLGDAVWGLKRFDEAETLLRQAVTLDADGWENWAALGRFLNGKASRLIYKKDGRGALNGPDSAVKAEPLLREAAACLDRVVALAPREPEAYRARFDHRVERSFLQVALTAALGRPVDAVGQNPVLAMYVPEARADIHQLARCARTTTWPGASWHRPNYRRT